MKVKLKLTVKELQSNQACSSWSQHCTWWMKKKKYQIQLHRRNSHPCSQMHLIAPKEVLGSAQYWNQWLHEDAGTVRPTAGEAYRFIRMPIKKSPHWNSMNLKETFINADITLYLITIRHLDLNLKRNNNNNNIKHKKNTDHVYRKRKKIQNKSYLMC